MGGRPAVDRLEDRLAPALAANLYVSGTTLVLDAANGSSGGVLSVSETDGAIVGGNGPGVVNVTTPALGLLNLSAGPGGIDLDTSVAKIGASVASGSLPGDINLRGDGIPLTFTSATTTDGDITATNDQGLTVSATASNNLTFVTTGGSVGIDVAQSTSPTRTLTVDSAAQITTSVVGDVLAPTVNLTATAGIGTPSNPLFIGSGIVPETTLSAVTDSGGIAVQSLAPLTVAGPTANSGAVALTTFGGDLTVAGQVTTADGSAITLTSANDLVLSAGTVSSNTGPIVLAPAANLTVAAPVVVTTGSAAPTVLTVDAPTDDTVIDVAGTLAAGAGASRSMGPARMRP